LGALLGRTGFGVGGVAGAVGGLAAISLSGMATTWIMFYCRRLEEEGVTAVTQFAFRYLPYVALATLGWVIGVDAKPSVAAGSLQIFLIGIVVIAMPSFLVQKAIHIVSPLFIAVASALGPFVVFGLQLVDGRVHLAAWTLVGLCIYCVASLMLVAGAPHHHHPHHAARHR
jgi:drug/metabolite transporter (DMT)-like permease